MSLQEQYALDLSSKGFIPDTAQKQAMLILQGLADMLNGRSGRSQHRLMQKLFGPTRIPGIYLRGGVGRGKTYLMDMFYDELCTSQKRRVHYHRFMLDIHEQLRVLPKSPNPLNVIGRNLASSFQVLCLDEFHVLDVADAMLLAGLLRALFRYGVTLVMTSNTRIDDLYRNGLQRERFLEAIALLQAHTMEVDLQPGQDYRLLHLRQGESYLAPGPETNQRLERKFRELTAGKPAYGHALCVHGRKIRTLALADDVVWFDFHDLCDTPRAAKDYIEIACLFHTVFVSGIPILADAQDNAAKRFMHLVDALYDHRVKLIASACVPPLQLYRGRLLQGAFERTVSRLIEMGSLDYLSLPHKP